MATVGVYLDTFLGIFNYMFSSVYDTKPNYELPTYLLLTEYSLVIGTYLGTSSFRNHPSGIECSRIVLHLSNTLH